MDEVMELVVMDEVMIGVVKELVVGMWMRLDQQ
ncbi:hypothetical protein Tco_0754550, partial [Tanacetum coccineum]